MSHTTRSLRKHTVMNRKGGNTDIPTPPKLASAVNHVTRTFHEADRLYGQLTSFFCRSELHLLPIDDHFTISLHNFKELRQSTGVEESQLLSETIAQKTAPALIKGYFSFYVSCAAAHACDSYRELMEVARANEGSLNGKASEWAIASMRKMIKNSRFYAESWIQSVCENRTYRPAAHNNDVLLAVSWQPPMACFMAPFGPLPFREALAWERKSERHGSLVLAIVASLYERRVLSHVERLAATEEFNALKKGDLMRTPPAEILPLDASKKPSAIMHVRREARRKQTQAQYRDWQREYRKWKKKHPGMSVVWYATKLATSEAGMAKSAETVRKHLKK